MNENMAEEGVSTVFDLLWAADRGRKRGPKPRLTREAVVAAAIDVADREGLEAVTMQRLARALNSKPMTLYRHVPSKEALTELMWDAALGAAPLLPDDDWRQALKGWAAASFESLERHPWMIELVGSIRSVGPGWTAWLEAGLAGMRALKLGTGEKLAVLTLIDGHLRSAARLRFGIKASPEWAADFGHMVQRVSADASFPMLAALARNANGPDEDMSLGDMFTFGLDRILDGVGAFAERRA
ncbi:TetR/AcrR family transcriptional regulator [Sphingosinicella sp. BN140058]|uniref:TetR/AcrR family transcriptional regulator n=1 Tax=Sphingosinicella sp. BN140058 TaxID=1892855 RepID=UPI001013151E|nr:TetR/AcrR family transcriptional regulator [Sphingosinicella sp. BN140058]QAY78845.1 TetR family transcriptional regulator [Sphingosinicella sp. BN140058]